MFRLVKAAKPPCKYAFISTKFLHSAIYLNWMSIVGELCVLLFHFSWILNICHYWLLICNNYYECLIPWNHWPLGVGLFGYKCFLFSICILSCNCFIPFNLTSFLSPVNHYLEWELALKQTVPQISLPYLCVAVTLYWTGKKKKLAISLDL